MLYEVTRFTEPGCEDSTPLALKDEEGFVYTLVGEDDPDTLDAIAEGTIVAYFGTVE